MTKKKVCMIIILAAFFITGCSDSSKSKNGNTDSTNMQTKTTSENPEHLKEFSDGSEMTKAKENNGTMLAAIVTPDNSQYETFMKILDQICQEKSIDYCVVDSSDEKNANWIDKNGVLGERAISVAHAGEIMSMALDYDDEFNYGFLLDLVEDFMTDLEEIAKET